MAFVKLQSNVLDESQREGLRRVVSLGRDYLELTKPRIMLFLLLTGYCAMVVAAGRAPDLARTFWTMLGLALSTGGAAALNMWYDRDIDAIMLRTQKRPLPEGRLSDADALSFGIVLQAASFFVLGYQVNWLSAWLAFGGFVYYVFLYTMWLKRRTPQNIVIGGGAGAMPPLVGWAAVTGHLDWAPILIFMIVFFWTPPHFWALAMYKQTDYTRAGIPMMPSVRGEGVAKRQSLVYTVLLWITTISLYLTHTVGLFYLGIAIILSAAFTYYVIRMMLEPNGSFVWAKKTFVFSLLYLVGLFLAMVCNVQV
ncbi:heme o synthase [Fodinisporobacter ferrooxydans]|uniref:Protoheme IX farnesyltransferase n=1 Tax=Fodinisporobacter ferrooxydans TaxID=2901836 RepID=A0ABY4CK60_9BACL|nr:heme o synthase [Alicyclobacillaceae bacterium MYW30-H2]